MPLCEILFSGAPLMNCFVGWEHVEPMWELRIGECRSEETVQGVVSTTTRDTFCI